MNTQNGNSAEPGLRRYLRLIGRLLGAVMEQSWYEWQPEITAYLPLNGAAGSSINGTPALWWDERLGWALGVDTHDDFEIIARHIDTVVPPPRVVAAFARDVLDGTWSYAGPASTAELSPTSRAEVLQALAAYAPTLGDPAQENDGPHRI